MELLGFQLLADDLEVLAQQRAQLRRMPNEIGVEPRAGGLVTGQSLIVAAIQDLTLEELPERPISFRFGAYAGRNGNSMRDRSR
jgi:hypothetical protein